MKKISSGGTYFYKHVFPVFWFCFLALFLFGTLLVGVKSKDIYYMFMIIPIVLGAGGYFIMKNLVFDLIDEVYDEGGSLLFRNGQKEVRVDFKDIKSIKFLPFMSPPRVSVEVIYETDFGRHLSFFPLLPISPFSKNKDIEELIDRIRRDRG